MTDRDPIPESDLLRFLRTIAGDVAMVAWWELREDSETADCIGEQVFAYLMGWA